MVIDHVHPSPVKSSTHSQSHEVMLRIAVTYTGTDQKQHNYLQWLHAEADCEPVTISAAQPHLDELDLFDGLVLTGGIDVDPAIYGAAHDYANAPAAFNPARDNFERAVYEFALNKGLPILGICRGMQLINALSGGTLRQDLGKAGNRRHRADPDDLVHELSVVPGSQLGQILGSERPMRINSAHHQCILQPAPGFRVGSFSEDGTPESLERISYGDDETNDQTKDKTNDQAIDPANDRRESSTYLLGVQWHPERMFQQGLGDEPASTAIRNSFLSAVRTYRATIASKAIH